MICCPMGPGDGGGVENRDNAWQSAETHGRDECCHIGPDMGEQLCLCGRDASTVAESLSSGNSLRGYL